MASGQELEESPVPHENPAAAAEFTVPVYEETVDEGASDLPEARESEEPVERPDDIPAEELPTGPELEAMNSGGSQTETGSLFINNETTKSAAPEVDTQTGALQYAYAFSIPPGRNGLEPETMLRYGSNSTSNSEIFGYGWSLSIPSISRSNKYGTDKLYSSDSFSSSMDGELVRVGTTTSFMPRVENGSFRQYVFASSTWTVTEKDGKKMTFGSTTFARRDDTASSTRIYAWELEETRDTNDNYVRYSYFKDGGQIYPESISYTGNGTADGPFLIEFTRESRSDNLVSYAAGFVATTSYRISNVRASVDGEWVSSYELDYSAGHNGNRSLLASIAKSGRDELTEEEKTLPATLFEYKAYGSGDKRWQAEAGIAVPVDIVGSVSQPETGARFVDINGDGLPDIIKSQGANPNPLNSAPYGVSQEVFLHTGDGWATTTDWTIPSPAGGRFGFAAGYFDYGPELAYSGTGVDLGARFSDVNGDGYTDIVWAYNTSAISVMHGFSWDYAIRDVYINNKTNGWATTTDWILPSQVQFGNDVFPGASRIADVNGDGLPDFVSANCSPGGEVLLNKGAGWVPAATSTWLVPEALSCNGSDTGTQIADVNGDGLPDILRSLDIEDNDEPGYPRINKVYLNNGDGWTRASSWTVPVAFTLSRINSYPIHTLSPRLTDINGDGLADIIRSSEASSGYRDGSNVYINTGEGWTEDSSWIVPPYFKFTKTNSGSTYQVDSGYAEMDFDGDNLIDFVKSGIVNSANPYNYYPHEEYVYLHEGTVPDLLSSVTYPEGGKVEVIYEQSSRYESAGNRLNPKLSSNLNTVRQVAYDDGIAVPYAHSYTYGGGENYYASSTDRKFAGFATTTDTDSRGNVTSTYIHQGNGSQSFLGEYADSFAKIGKPYLLEKYDDDSNLYARSLYRWDTATTSVSSAYTFNVQEISQQYDGDSDHKDTAIERIYATTTGNLLTQIEWGEVTATSTAGSFTDLGSDKRTTTYAYASSSSSTPHSRPSKETVTNQAGIRSREVKYFYDSLGTGHLTKGNRTSREDSGGPSSSFATTWTYDSYGLPLQEVNPRFATTTFTYDADHLYIATTTDALSHVTVRTYDNSSGKPRTTRNANGFVSEYLYDGLDRLVAEKMPDPLSGSVVLALSNSYTDTRNHVSMLSKKHLNASTSIDAYRYADGFGRIIQERVAAEDPGIYTARDWIYGDEGLLVRESLPYFAIGTADSDPVEEDALWISYDYDPLNRRESIENAVGVTEISHDQWKKSAIDPLERTKVHVYDAFGRLSSVEENVASSTYITSYAWGNNDVLTSITDALGNTRNITYNWLGQRTSAQDLHAASDATFGTWNYQYDGVGNLTQSTDPNGAVVQRTYDMLNRPLTENYTGAAGTEVSYAYDSCANGIGMLCHATSTDSVTKYTYAPNGLVASESKRIAGSDYVTSYAYDRAGNQISILYPDASSVAYAFNGAGKLEAVQQKEAGGSYKDVVSDIDYGPNGLVTYQENANQSYTTNVYDEQALYRLARKTVQALPAGDSGELLRTSGNAEEQLQGTYELSSYFAPDGHLLSKVDGTEAFETGARAKSATTTPVSEGGQEGVSRSVEEVRIASSSARTRLKNLPADSQELALKVPLDRQLGMSESDGIVTYAFRTDTSVSQLVPDQATMKAARAAGVELMGEVVDKRTKYARTFSTDKPGVFVSEIVSGKPRYYEDAEGQWWLAEYGETTKEAYELQIERQRKESRPALTLQDAVKGIASLFIPARAYASSGVFYPDPNPEVSTVDGTVYKDNSTSWNTVRTASAGNWVYDYQSGIGVLDQQGNGNGSNYKGIKRGFIIFDTSSIPDGAVITGGSLDLYVIGANAAGSEKRIYVVSSNPASNTSLTYEDYDQVGSTEFGVSDANYAVNTYESIPLNANGQAYISKTGYTKLGLRTYNDLYNVVSTNSNELTLDFASAETNGLSESPKLIVTYSIAPSIPTGLIAKQKLETPGGSVKVVPEFSAVFLDPDAGDAASAYDIQISLSPSDWSVPVWDSGKRALPGPVANGSRIADIAYDGDDLATGIEYYWRLKFWDRLDAAGAWSTTTVSFMLMEPPPALMDLVYNYDAVGNIISIIDITELENPAAMIYEYDDLDRLTRAATTTADIAFLEQLIIVQPSPVEGKDTMYGTVYVTSGGHTYDTARIGGWGDEYFSFFEFPLGEVQDDEGIASAYLHLYSADNNGFNAAKLARVTDPWTENGVSYSSNPSSTDLGAGWQEVLGNEWTVMDVTQLVKDWKAGVHENYGVKVTGQYNGSDVVKAFRTSDYADAQYRPKLVVHGSHDASVVPDIVLGTTTATVETYAYDAIGNITSRSGQGLYTYAGTGHANPHAPTSVASSTLAYDNNGNLTSAGISSFVWDYRNRILNSTSAGQLTGIYRYDHADARVSRSSSGITTHYPNDFYEKTATASIKHIFLAGQPIATVYGTGTSTATTTFIHADHLGSARFVTDAAGIPIQSLNYDSFGSQTKNATTTVFSESNQFIAEQYDQRSGLSYLNARYYDGGRGQFLSQDPVFWEIGQTNDGVNALLDPQLQNSYSYARNNPITGKDPTGRQNMWTGFNWANNLTGGHVAGMVQNELMGYGMAVRTALGLAPGSGDAIAAQEAYGGTDYVTGERMGSSGRALAGFSVLPVLGTAGDAGRAIRAGDRVAGLGVTKHAADGFADRGVSPQQVSTALKEGVKYLDTRTNNLLHIVGERGRGGYTIVTDQAQKSLVSVENFVRNLTPKNSPDRFKKLDN